MPRPGVGRRVGMAACSRGPGSGQRRAPLARSLARFPHCQAAGMLHRPELAVRHGHHRAGLELSDAHASGRSWCCPTRAPAGRAGRGDDGCRPGARHRGRAGAVRRARPPGPSWTRRRWLPRWRAPAGPSWSCPAWAPRGTRARQRGRAGTVRRGRPPGGAGAVGRARQRTGLELSDARAPPGRAGAVRRTPPGPSRTRRPWLPSWSAPPGPSWSGPTRAPLARAGAVGRARLHRLSLLGRADMLQRRTGALTRSTSLD